MKIGINKYLERIKFEGIPGKNIETLKNLHKNHIFNIPFENLDIHYGNRITLDIDKLFEKIVINNRGGFCYELNGLFYELLNNIGFNAKMVSGRVKNLKQKDMFNPEFDHMLIVVDLDGLWLADVGFGDSFIEPLKIELNTIQKQYGKLYKIIRHDEKYLRLMSSKDNKHFLEEFLFTLEERTLNEFQAMCNYHQTSPESIFTQKKVCTIATSDGRITLGNSKLIITRYNKKNEIELKSEEEFNEKLKEYFNMAIN